VVMFHHDPDHDDVFLESIEASVQVAYPNSLLAREGMTISVPLKVGVAS
jgi:hypothetical protein